LTIFEKSYRIQNMKKKTAMKKTQASGKATKNAAEQAKKTPKVVSKEQRTVGVKHSAAKITPQPTRTSPAKASAPRRAGLGRGLDALISAKAAAAAQRDIQAAREEIVSSIKNINTKKQSTEQAGQSPAAQSPNAIPGEEFIKVKTNLIHRSPWQPRGTFNQESLHELAETIKVHGLIQALTCRRIPASKGGGFELISGERRLRAAIEAGLDEVPVRVIDVSDRDAAEMAVIENIQRDDLNAIEEAEGYRTLIDEFHLTQQEVADRVGKGRASVAHALRLLELPDEVKQLVSAGQLSVGHAKVLLSLESDTEQTLLARKCVLSGQSVRALEKAIARKEIEKEEMKSRRDDIPESHARFLLDKLHGFFGSPVRLRPSVTFSNGKRARGSIEIDFVDNDDLSRILDLLGIIVD